MPLRPQKGNMYNFVTHTWNPIKGDCLHDCSYCYMKRWGKQKKARLVASELKTDLGGGNFIFVGSSTDIFSDNIPESDLAKIFLHCHDFPMNQYLWQTKNLERFNLFFRRGQLPGGANVCTTIESNRDYPVIMQSSPSIDKRVNAFNKTHDFGLLINKRMITIEPIMDFDNGAMREIMETCRPDQINIGADSGGNNLPEPTKEKIFELIFDLEELGINVHLKKNLSRIVGKTFFNE